MPLSGDDDAAPGSHRDTNRMPACLAETGAATAALTGGRARTSIVRKVREPDARAEPLSTREAQVLSLVDGNLSLRSLVDVSGMPENDVRMILDNLARLGVIALD